MSPTPAPLLGSVTPPGDKSTTHRALLLGGLARGETLVRRALDAADTRSTLGVVQALGAEVVGLRESGGFDAELRVRGCPAPLSPEHALACGNAGTLARLLLGLLAPRRGSWRLSGDASLSRRPMGRVTRPLGALGAQMLGEQLPLDVHGAKLRGGQIAVDVPSAQVKSALLLAGLGAEAPLTVSQAIATRDETERMLPRFGISLERSADSTTVHPGELCATTIDVPGDASAAAFALVAALLVPGSAVRVEGVDLSPRRTGFLRALDRAGARVLVKARATPAVERGPLRAGGTALTRSGADSALGQIGDLETRFGELQPFEVAPEDVPDLVDELPLLTLVACAASGRSRFAGLAELRVKESDRLAEMAKLAEELGAKVELREDELIVEGAGQLRAPRSLEHEDHRVAMSRAIAHYAVAGGAPARPASAAISYPSFADDLQTLGAR